MTGPKACLSGRFGVSSVQMDLAALKAFLDERKQPAYRFTQAARAFYVELEDSWDKVTPWPKALREEAAAVVPWGALTPGMTQENTSGDTVKTLFSCADGAKIETVLMRNDPEAGAGSRGDRNTVCISCQVGCPMGCTFCATGTMGLKRNLTVHEMVEQVIFYARWLKAKGGRRVTNVVYMGMGEPMNNYNEVMRSVRLLNADDGFNLGARHISISTCGVVPGILKLAEEPEQVNLAISLHSGIDSTRSKIMPVNKAYDVTKLMRAVRTYTERTNRKVFFEYLMLKGVNDSLEEADAVADILEENPRLYHVNVIKYHDTDAFESTPKDGRMAFIQRLKERHIPVTHRRTFGEEIEAACGQLAINESDGKVSQGLEAVHLNRESRHGAAKDWGGES
jgi:23S rRNA (adenine2503-C2)-methyltransferase